MVEARCRSFLYMHMPFGFYRLNEGAWNSRNKVSFGTLASGHDGYHDGVELYCQWQSDQVLRTPPPRWVSAQLLYVWVSAQEQSW